MEQPPELRDVWPKTFREAVCDCFGCQPDDYERKVFWRCMHRHALPIAFLIYRVEPGFFREDFDLIREVGRVRNPVMFTTELNYFHGRNARDRSWLRTDFYIRVSGKRLLNLKNRIFQPK